MWPINDHEIIAFSTAIANSHKRDAQNGLETGGFNIISSDFFKVLEKFSGIGYCGTLSDSGIVRCPIPKGSIWNFGDCLTFRRGKVGRRGRDIQFFRYSDCAHPKSSRLPISG